MLINWYLTSGLAKSLRKLFQAHYIPLLLELIYILRVLLNSFF